MSLYTNKVYVTCAIERNHTQFTHHSNPLSVGKIIILACNQEFSWDAKKSEL